MGTPLEPGLIRSIILTCNLPIVLRKFVSNWAICNWNEEMWCSAFGEKKIPFRTMKRDYISDEPCWERKCQVRDMSFKQFLETMHSEQEWMYFDYKYLHQWFSNCDEMFKSVSWKQFGYDDKSAADSTLWVGSCGSHTPAHQDTYGVNIVAQLYGKKRWLLFPPETGGLKPTRVPYEESSVYSELNFYCPNNLDAYKGLSGGRVVELSAGDALLLPRGWWHYVQNVEPLNIAVNCWLPHAMDNSARVSEALIKILVAQICKDLPSATRKLILNPNEDGLCDTPLAVLFLELETVAKMHSDNRRKSRRAKRQKTIQDDPKETTFLNYDLKSLVENKANNLELPKPVSSEEIIDLLKMNLKEFADVGRPLEDDETDGATASLCLTKALIDAYSESHAIEQVKQNLLAKLS